MNPTHLWSEVTLKNPTVPVDPTKEYVAVIKGITARIEEDDRLNLTLLIEVDNKP